MSERVIRRAKANKIVRASLEQTGVRYYELAERMGIREDTFSKLLRKELPLKEQYEMVDLIHKIVEELNNA